MFAIQAAIKYTEKNIGRYLFLGVIVFVTAVTSVIGYRISNAGSSNITVIDTIELTCDININENDEISFYKLTVAGYLRTGDAYTEGITPMILQSFDLITDGTIESIENIVLSIHVNGDTEAVKYDFAYAVLEKQEGNTKNAHNNCEIVYFYKDGDLIDAWGNRCENGGTRHKNMTIALAHGMV